MTPEEQKRITALKWRVAKATSLYELEEVKEQILQFLTGAEQTEWMSSRYEAALEDLLVSISMRLNRKGLNPYQF